MAQIILKYLKVQFFSLKICSDNCPPPLPAHTQAMLEIATVALFGTPLRIVCLIRGPRLTLSRRSCKLKKAKLYSDSSIRSAS